MGIQQVIKIRAGKLRNPGEILLTIEPSEFGGKALKVRSHKKRVELGPDKSLNIWIQLDPKMFTTQVLVAIGNDGLDSHLSTAIEGLPKGLTNLLGEAVLHRAIRAAVPKLRLGGEIISAKTISMSREEVHHVVMLVTTNTHHSKRRLGRTG